jgi:hypothetical protein
MESSDSGVGFRKARLGTRLLAFVLSFALLFITWPENLQATQDAPPPQDAQTPPPDQQGGQQDAPRPAYSQQSKEQLEQLVAPIALYPDSLVAQILAAATFPEQVVEADRWVQNHPDLKGDALGQEVDKMSWDPSVKALTGFPSVLGNMDKNLSWTSSLGDAYYNQQPDVMDAIQVMRKRAQKSGNLKNTEQQTVTSDGPDVQIAPANPDVVYVPAYDPWVVYGPPLSPWPGWYPYPGIWFGGPYLSFGVGFGIGWYGGFGWGWPRWGFDWRNRAVLYNRNRYYSRSTTFYNRNNAYARGAVRGGVRGGGYANRPEAGRGGVYNRPGGVARPFNGNSQAARGYAQSRGGERGVRSGAFSGYSRGGEARSYSSRGSASFGGGGGARGGGGGHGGGGRH